jgi:hypothetical protein
VIAGLPIEYAQARLQARYGERASERVWNQLRGARTFAALLDTARGSTLRRWVAAVAADAIADEVELGLRAVFRAHVAEVAGWLPEAWQAAALWTAHLVDLPAIVLLARGEAPLPWMRSDPVLQAYADPDADARRAALRAGPLGAIVHALQGEPVEAAAKGPPDAALARRMWVEAWHRRAPGPQGDDTAALAEMARLVEAHLVGMLERPADDAWASRRTLGAQLESRFRRHALRPPAAFAHLAVVALDLERLRAELVGRAAFGVLP